MITREGSASNGGWFEVQLDGQPEKKVYYRRGSMIKLKPPPATASSKGKASSSAHLQATAIPAHTPAAALQAIPAQLPASATLVTPISSFLVQQPQPHHATIATSAVQGYSLPPSPVYLTCLPSQSLTPLSLPAGSAPLSGSFLLSSGNGMEGVAQPHHQHHQLYLVQSPPPQLGSSCLSPSCLSPSSASSASSALSSSGSSFAFSGGRRASTGSLMEPPPHHFASASPCPIAQPALAPIVAMAQPTRAQISGSHPSAVNSPPILVLHSPPLVSLRATSTPVQLYQHPPLHQQPSSVAFVHSGAASQFLAMHPSNLPSAGFEVAAPGRASAFTSVGSFSASHGQQQPTRLVAPLSPSSGSHPSVGLVAPRALRLSHPPVAPLSAAPHPPTVAKLAAASAASLPLQALSLSSSVSAPAGAAAPATWHSTSTPSSPCGRSACSASSYRADGEVSAAAAPLHRMALPTPPYPGLTSAFQLQALESTNRKRRRASLDVDLSLVAASMASTTGTGEEPMAIRTSHSSICHPAALLPALCQSVALCSL